MTSLSRRLGSSLFACALCAAGFAACSPEAKASPFTYTFAGSGGGSVNGAAFTGPFTFVFNADTAAIDASGAPFYRLFNVGGTFTEGAFSATLLSNAVIVATADLNFPRINVFNATATDGIGLNDPGLAGFALSTAIGPITVTAPGDATHFLTPTFGADGFATVGGGSVSITADSTLTFSAALARVSAIPEPASLTLLGAGLLGLGLRRRRC